MKIKKTQGRFGFSLVGGKDEPYPTSAIVQICVKSSSLSRTPDIVISEHLMTISEIDHYIDQAVADLEAIRIMAKKAIQKANPS